MSLQKSKEPLILEIFDEAVLDIVDEQQFRCMFVLFSVDLHKTL